MSGKWNCLKFRVDLLEPPMNNSVEMQDFLFLNVKILQIEGTRFGMFCLHWISHLINSNCYNWAAKNSQMPDNFKICNCASTETVYFRWVAFENSNLVDANFHFFEKIRNFWFWNFYFRWFYICEKMSYFDGWPGVG